jgi:CHAD domain-containing protein
MPKARRVKELQAEIPLSQAAALILRVMLPQVLRYEDKTRANDIEGVHNMRIGAKRLREAVRVLRPAIPRGSRKRLLPTVERLNDLLGEVRDRDVMQEAFRDLTRQDSRTVALREVTKDLRRERKGHHKALLSFLDDLHKSDFASFYKKLMDEMWKEAAEGQPVLASFAVQAVEQRLEDVVDNLQAVHCPEEVALFHRERIRVKKLKYALEPFLAILPREAKPVYDQIAALQELMGLVHDVDVQTALLTAWQKEYKAEQGLKVAEKLLAGNRGVLIGQTLEHVAAMEAAAFDENLLALLHAMPATAGPDAGGESGTGRRPSSGRRAAS